MLDMNMIVDYARYEYDSRLCLGWIYWYILLLWFYINYTIIYIKVEPRPTYFFT
jgi:hypothetical protein